MLCLVGSLLSDVSNCMSYDFEAFLDTDRTYGANKALEAASANASASEIARLGSRMDEVYRHYQGLIVGHVQSLLNGRVD